MEKSHVELPWEEVEHGQWLSWFAMSRSCNVFESAAGELSLRPNADGVLSGLNSIRNEPKLKVTEMAVEIDVTYLGDLKCQATHGPSGSSLTSEAPVDNGGTGGSFSPTDLVATALGTCVMTILGLMAKRHDVDLVGMHVHVTKEMITAPIRRIGGLKTQVTIPSGKLEDPTMRSRFEAAARTCPVHQSLHPDIEAPIEFTYE